MTGGLDTFLLEAKDRIIINYQILVTWYFEGYSILANGLLIANKETFVPHIVEML